MPGFEVKSYELDMEKENLGNLPENLSEVLDKL